MSAVRVLPPSLVEGVAGKNEVGRTFAIDMPNEATGGLKIEDSLLKVRLSISVTKTCFNNFILFRIFGVGRLLLITYTEVQHQLMAVQVEYCFKSTSNT